MRVHGGGQPVVGLAGPGQPLGSLQSLRGRRHVRDDLHVDAVGVQVLAVGMGLLAVGVNAIGRRRAAPLGSRQRVTFLS